MGAATRKNPCAKDPVQPKKKKKSYNSIKKNKTLWVNLTQKKCKTGSYKILLKEIKDPNKWKDLCVHELEDLVFLRWQ